MTVARMTVARLIPTASQKHPLDRELKADQTQTLAPEPTVARKTVARKPTAGRTGKACQMMAGSRPCLKVDQRPGLEQAGQRALGRSQRLFCPQQCRTGWDVHLPRQRYTSPRRQGRLARHRFASLYLHRAPELLGPPDPCYPSQPLRNGAGATPRSSVPVGTLRRAAWEHFAQGHRRRRPIPAALCSQSSRV